MVPGWPSATVLPRSCASCSRARPRSTARWATTSSAARGTSSFSDPPCSACSAARRSASTSRWSLPRGGTPRSSRFRSPCSTPTSRAPWARAISRRARAGPFASPCWSTRRRTYRRTRLRAGRRPRSSRRKRCERLRRVYRRGRRRGRSRARRIPYGTRLSRLKSEKKSWTERRCSSPS